MLNDFINVYFFDSLQTKIFASCWKLNLARYVVAKIKSNGLQFTPHNSENTRAIAGNVIFDSSTNASIINKI